MPFGSGSQINPSLPNNGPAGAGIVNRTNSVTKTAGQSLSLIEVALGTPAEFLTEQGITDGSVGPLDGIGFITGSAVGDPDQIRKGYAREITPGNPIAQLDIDQKAPLYSRGTVMNASGFKRLDDGRWFDAGSNAIIAELSASGAYVQVVAGQNDRSIFGRGQGLRYVYKRPLSVTTEIMDPQTQ